MKYEPEYFAVHDVEYAKLFEHVKHNSNLDGEVKIVGNSSTDEEADDLFANVRFKLKIRKQ